MFAYIRALAGLAGLALLLSLQACEQYEETANSDTPAATEAVSSSSDAVALSEADNIPKPIVDVVIAKDPDTSSASSFPPDSPRLYAFFHSSEGKQGDMLRGVWIAEDVGGAEKEAKLDEATMVANSTEFSGNFSTSRPGNEWPVGIYRVDIYVGDSLAGSRRFAIE